MIMTMFRNTTNTSMCHVVFTNLTLDLHADKSFFHLVQLGSQVTNWSVQQQGLTQRAPAQVPPARLNPRGAPALKNISSPSRGTEGESRRKIASLPRSSKPREAHDWSEYEEKRKERDRGQARHRLGAGGGRIALLSVPAREAKRRRLRPGGPFRFLFLFGLRGILIRIRRYRITFCRGRIRVRCRKVLG
ncbi:hypothetical protein GW17_00006609 [Ensete ventricosum]|nr:hypothetical protein GW17_00006609 [Ensete ventricosum]